MIGQNRGKRRAVLGVAAIVALGTAALGQTEGKQPRGLNLTFSTPEGAPRMTDPDGGKISTVETQPDGSTIFTHGHRFPDNVQVVEQHHDASGKLIRAKVRWSGFAGDVLNVTATFDDHGKLVKEEGFRAPEMTTPVSELILPLPTATATAPSLAEALRKIYPVT